MKNQNRIKNKIIKYCIDQIRQAERAAEEQSISLIEAYKNEEKRAYRDVENKRKIKSGPPPDYDTIEENLTRKLDLLKRNLLDIEINLQDALNESIKKFTSKISAVLEEMKNLTIVYINSEVLVEVEQFSTKLVEEGCKEKERIDREMNDDPDAAADYDEVLKNEGMDPVFIPWIIIQPLEDVKTTLQNFKENLNAKIS